VSGLRGLLLGLALLLVVPAAHAAGPPFTTMPMSRFGGDQPGAGLEDAAGRDLPGRLGDPRLIPVRVRPSRAVCATRARWTVDGDPVRATPDPPRGQARGSCAWTLTVRRPGTYRLAVDTRAGVQTREVVVRDRLVVTLGDSVASGEGNPRIAAGSGKARFDTVWLERRCHRSAFSGFELAARRLARRSERDTSITFVNLACSGATIARGILGPYAGIEPVPGGRDELRPQLAGLAALAAARGGKADAVMISVGANDVRFGSIVALCATPPGGCARGKLGGIPASEAIPDLLAGLEPQYDRLARSLGDLVASPRDVLLTEYFNPTRDRHGDVCTRSLGAARRDDLRFAEASLLLPLNDAGRAAARRKGFTYVPGIRRRFTRHGYCAGKERWVVRISDSLLKSAGSTGAFRTKGTMHPNAAGHEAIADALAPRLARRLGLPRPQAPARPPALDVEAAAIADKDPSKWAYVALGLLALLVVVLVFRDWARRVTLLFRPSGRDDPAEAPPPAAVAPHAADSAWVRVLVTAAKAVGAVASLTGLVLLLGGTILWVRFASVGAPAGQAVNAAGQREWLVTGWHALILFVLVAGIAVLITHLLDRRATMSRPTRRGLMLVLVLELTVAVAIGDFRTEEKLQLVAGFALATFLLHLLIDHAIPAGQMLQAGNLADVPERTWGWLVGNPGAHHRRRRIAWRVLALVPLAGALVAASVTERDDRWLFVGAALAIAVVMFTARGGIADDVDAREAGKPVDASLETPRVLLSATILACLAILLGRDEIWLLGAAGTAAALALVCLIVAAASATRFWPYAIAVMIAVPLYGAVLFSIRAVDRPELQPLAAIAPDGQAVCGLYVGRTDGRIWYAELDLDENVPKTRSVRLRGRLTSVPDGDDTVMRVAPLQSLADAQVRAARLRDELLAERARPPGGPTCTTAASKPIPPTRRERQLRQIADRFAPDLLVSKGDRFPPTSVLTMFALHDRRRQTCRRVDPNHCLRLSHPGELPWSGGAGQYLDYPAKPRSRSGQRASLIRTLGTADPEQSATTYYLVAGRGDEPLSVQHWFYYPFNYQRVFLGPGRVSGGFHEGDFESVGVLLSARDHLPRAVWMARHDREGRVFGWNETALDVSAGHVRVHVARGSHASYEHCGRQVRPVGGGKVDDHVPCDDADLLHFNAASTRRVDLARAGWACWRGRFGQSSETVLEGLPQVVNNGPLSPLWQQSFGGVENAPCRGVRDPGSRQGPAEAVNPPQTAARLRERAGSLVPLVDDCGDWTRPPLGGVIIVACNQDVLDAFVGSGFRDPGPEQVRIARPDDPPPRSTIPDVPAVQRDHDALRPSEWRITTQRTTRMTIYLSCRQGRRTLDARFEDVELRPGLRYRIDDRGPEVWRLHNGLGDVIAEATPVHDGAPAGATVDCSARQSVRP